MMKKESFINLMILLGILALDRLAKYVLVDSCFGIFCIKTAFNNGASFGILPGTTPFLIVVASFVLVLMAYFYSKVDGKTKLAFTLIGAGTLGNLADRIFFGGVIDLFSILNSSSFNVADMSNLAGGIILLYVIFGSKKKSLKK